MEQKTEASQAVKFRKKPVEIEAIQWTGSNLLKIIEFTDGRKPDNRHDFAAMKWDEYAELVKRDGLKIFTLEGKMNADVGDWIIKGVKNEFYPCKPDIFELTYERAALKAQPAPTEAQGNTSNNSSSSAQGEDSARLDAERYRWLCEKYGVTWFPCFLEQKLECGYIADGKESIDATIDRARASAETGGVKP